MKYNPDMTDEASENQSAPPPSNVLPPGIYAFTVLEARDEVSKAGNDMMHVKLGAERPNGTQQWVHDYIVATQPAKLKALCAAVGMLAEFARGDIPAEEFVGASGKVKLKIEPAKGSFPEKNSVAEYVERKAESPAAAKPEPQEEIPF